MNIIVVTPPAFEPVTVEEAYQHLRWDPEPGSPTEYPLLDLVERNITTAREDAERATRRAFVKQTLRAVFPCFQDRMEMRRPPFAELVSVEYLDADGLLQTLSSDYYHVDTMSDIVPAVVVDSRNLPVVTAERADAVRITWVAGYPWEGSPGPDSQEDAAAGVPKAIKDAILIGVQLLADRFDAGERAALEAARDALLFSYKVHSF